MLLLLLSSCPTVDDAEIAGSHALRQIPVKNSFRRWSVGIISKVKRIFLGIEILLKTSQKSTQAAEFGLESYIWKLFWWIMRPGQLWSQEKAKWEKEMCSSYFWCRVDGLFFSTQYAVGCKQMHIDCIAWVAILRAADRQFGRIEQDFVLFRFVCQQTKTAPHDKLQ